MLMAAFKQTINKSWGNKRAFTLTEVLIALGIIAVIAVLILPVVTTRAQNKSFALSYSTQVKQMLNSLDGLPTNENKDDITNTMMSVSKDTNDYSSSAGAYINKYMKVVKYCGNSPGDCFGDEYFQFKDNDKVAFDIKDIKGACALLKNGVSICLKPQIQGSNNDEITGWLDLNGPKGPNIYGRDLRTFSINLKQKAVYTEEEPTEVIMPDPPAPCKGDNCGPTPPDPCQVNPQGEECCKKRSSVVDKNDVCCPWYLNIPGSNHDKCFPETPDCDPQTDPACREEYCKSHTITGPTDACCKIVKDPNCCAPGDTSDYCCSSKNQFTQGCCIKRIETGDLKGKYDADNTCCTKYPAIKEKYALCKSECQLHPDGEACCNTTERREKIRDPHDACCEYAAVNGIDTKGYDNDYNRYCCRLPKNASNLCCEYKYNNGSPLTYYKKHDYNKGGNYGVDLDGCCKHNKYGIKSNNAAVLDRCCSVPKIESGEHSGVDKTNCCHYLVGKLGENSLLPSGKLRKCCSENEFKNKRQCCSNVTDGYAYDSSVPYASQCCMPNAFHSDFDKDIKTNVNCCFDVNGKYDQGYKWAGKRWEDCCSYGSQSYGSKTVNTIDRWQKNCCQLERGKYPSGATGLAAYNSACCSDNSSNRFKWSPNNNECCDTLDQQNSSSARGSQYWKDHCCRGYLTDKAHATTKPYYKTEKNCCQLDNNWTAGCCTESGLNSSDEKWKKNCCSMPGSYKNNKEYRKYCCFDSTTRITAKNEDNDHTMNTDNADNPSGKNAANKDTSKNANYCCDPKIADTYTTTDNGNTFVWSDAHTPNKSCCEYFKSRNWKDNDGEDLSKYYKAACCQKHNVCDGANSCEIKWMSGRNATNWGIPQCCLDPFTITKNNVTKPDVWQPGCCDYPTSYPTKSYKSVYIPKCCSASADYTRSGSGDLTKNKEYCCNPNTTSPNANCCKLFKTNGGGSDNWLDNDKDSVGDPYKVACCKNYDESYCPNSCSIRWQTGLPVSDVRNNFATTGNNPKYAFPRCCKDLAATRRSSSFWKNYCCRYAQIRTSDGYASFADYRSGCCKSNADQTFKDTNDGAGQNSLSCCIPNASNPTSGCCSLFKSQGWKDSDGNPLSDQYKIKCCQDNNVCPDSCALRSKTNNDKGQWNLPTCCNDATMYSEHKNDATWRGQCCKAANPGNLSRDQFRGVCCNDWVGSARDGNYKAWCCDGSTVSSAHGNACCNDTTGNGSTNQCTCSERLRKGLSVNISIADGTGKNCCENTKSQRSNSHWQSQCCGAGTNPGKLSDDEYRSSCCSNNTGSVKTGGSDTRCCRNTSHTKGVSHFCCANISDCAHCSCSDSWTLRRSQCFEPKKGKCCPQTASALMKDTNWQNTCCPLDQANSGLNKPQFKAFCCSPNTGNSTGYFKGGTNKDVCCSSYVYGQGCCSSTGVKWNGDAEAGCCNPKDQNPTENCCEWGKYGSQSQTWCCGHRSAYRSNHLTACCGLSWGSDCCTDGRGNSRVGQRTACCDGSSQSDYCCNNGYQNQCSCNLRLQKGYELKNVTVNGVPNTNCCTATKKDSDNPQNWINRCCYSDGTYFGGGSNVIKDCCTYPSSGASSGCCSLAASQDVNGNNYMSGCCNANTAGSLPNMWRCCEKYTSKMSPGSACCQAVQSHYSDWRTRFPDCIPICERTSTFVDNSSAAKSCCDNKYGLADDNTNVAGVGKGSFKDYCCSLTYKVNGSNTWMVGTPKECCPYRAGSTSAYGRTVYWYSPPSSSYDTCDGKNPDICSAVEGICGQACTSADNDCCNFWYDKGVINEHKNDCCNINAWADNHSSVCKKGCGDLANTSGVTRCWVDCRGQGCGGGQSEVNNYYTEVVCEDLGWASVDGNANADHDDKAYIVDMWITPTPESGVTGSAECYSDTCYWQIDEQCVLREIKD